MWSSVRYQFSLAAVDPIGTKPGKPIKWAVVEAVSVEEDHERARELGALMQKLSECARALHLHSRP